MGTYPTVLNVSNDLAVKLFLNNKITFTMIPEIIDETMNTHNSFSNPTLDNIKEVANWTENFVLNNYNKS